MFLCSLSQKRNQHIINIRFKFVRFVLKEQKQIHDEVYTYKKKKNVHFAINFRCVAHSQWMEAKTKQNYTELCVMYDQ